MRKPTNFATAIARLAPSAAKIAAGPVPLARAQAADVRCFSSVMTSTGVGSVPCDQGEVGAGVVGQPDQRGQPGRRATGPRRAGRSRPPRRSAASSAQASARAATGGARPPRAAARAAGPAARRPPRGRGTGPRRSRAAAHGPSKPTTWLWPASGRTPQVAGDAAFSLSWQAKRYAAVPVSGDAPQTTGSAPSSSSASDLPGLTRVSASGRQRCATLSSTVAVSTSSSGPAVISPSASAATSSGTDSDHSDAPRLAPLRDRDEQAAAAPGEVLDRAAGRTDDEQAAAAADGLLERGQGLLGGAGAGHRDDQVGGADPGRQAEAPVGEDRHRGSPGRRPPPGRRRRSRSRPCRRRRPRGAVLVGEPAETGLARQHGGLAHLRRAGRDGAQHPAGVGRLEGGGVVEVHRCARPGRNAHAGRRASSTSRTGMSSRTG